MSDALDRHERELAAADTQKQSAARAEAAAIAAFESRFEELVRDFHTRATAAKLPPTDVLKVSRFRKVSGWRLIFRQHTDAWPQGDIFLTLDGRLIWRDAEEVSVKHEALRVFQSRIASERNLDWLARSMALALRGEPYRPGFPGPG